jgi:acetyl-CoA carboxylase carboxyl transferase subunit alpha
LRLESPVKTELSARRLLYLAIYVDFRLKFQSDRTIFELGKYLPMSQHSNPLDFELPLVELEYQLEKLQDQITAGAEDKRGEYDKLAQKVEKLRAEIFGKLTAYQRVRLSRHMERPFTLDYIKYMASDFVELSGDRLYRDDPTIVGGTCKFEGINIMVVGHQRGRTTAERIKRNFGMAHPEGYRKALRLFRLAEKFAMPVVTMIDTSGADPGIGAEERGQSEAIARNLSELSELTVPVVCVVIGEGGSGGALALGVADRILMMEYACYSVISPEGCAEILFPTTGSDGESYKEQAAENMKITSRDLEKFGISDETVPEPPGGAHANPREAAKILQGVLKRHLDQLMLLSVEELLESRYKKFRNMGSLFSN